jgi:hypothetical protein
LATHSLTTFFGNTTRQGNSRDPPWLCNHNVGFRAFATLNQRVEDELGYLGALPTARVSAEDHDSVVRYAVHDLLPVRR